MWEKLLFLHKWSRLYQDNLLTKHFRNRKLILKEKSIIYKACIRLYQAVYNSEQIEFQWDISNVFTFRPLHDNYTFKAKWFWSMCPGFIWTLLIVKCLCWFTEGCALRFTSSFSNASSFKGKNNIKDYDDGKPLNPLWVWCEKMWIKNSFTVLSFNPTWVMSRLSQTGCYQIMKKRGKKTERFLLGGTSLYLFPIGWRSSVRNPTLTLSEHSEVSYSLQTRYWQCRAD